MTIPFHLQHYQDYSFEELRLFAPKVERYIITHNVHELRCVEAIYIVNTRVHVSCIQEL